MTAEAEKVNVDTYVTSRLDDVKVRKIQETPVEAAPVSPKETKVKRGHSFRFRKKAQN